MNDGFRKIISNKDQFVITWELIPGRGAWEESQDKVLRLAEQAAKGKLINAVSITDNPGGNTAVSPEVIGKEIANLGLETIIHLTCKDKNRNQLESQLYGLERLGLRNVLAMTGDYPKKGIMGSAKPVFDIDSTHLIQMITNMNNGIKFVSPRGETSLKPFNFVPGAAVSPFKATEAETLMQYSKLRKKAACGAQFLITQVGYDARKYQELLFFVNQMNWDIPLIGNLYMINYPVGRIMNQNKIPGCVVTDQLLAKLNEESQHNDKGLSAMIERAARQYAVLKGMGYNGVHLGGGNLSYEQIEHIIIKGEELCTNWRDYVQEFDYPQDNGFYLFAKDEDTGLNQANLNDSSKSYVHGADFQYKVSRGFHKMFFVPDKYLFNPMKSICQGIQGKGLEKCFHGAEHAAKSILYNCQDCGDCALTDISYVCPMGDCPKNQRNGPCQGSNKGWCEVYPNEKKCIWVRAYDRKKKYGEAEQLNSYQVSPYDWKLHHTSSWVNFYLGKDHSAQRLGIKEKS